MISGIISFLLGVLLLQQFSFLPSIHWCWALILVFSLPFIPSKYPFARNLIFFIAGFLWALFRAHLVLDIALPTDLQGRDVLVTGVVSSIPVIEQRKQRFEFDIETLKYQKENVNFPAKVRISWYRQSYGDKNLKSNIHVKAGQRWQFWLRLKQPHGFMNPGGFDFEGWLFQKKIRATGYVRINAKKQQFAKVLDDKAQGYNMLLLRQTLYDTISSLSLNNQYTGIMTALAIGERKDITQEQWRVFRQTGTSHLMAISGLHIGLLAGFIFFLVKRVWPYCGNAALYLASPKAAALLSLLLAMLYAAMSGFAVPAQRALIMLSVVMFSIFRSHKVQGSKVLGLALFTVLLFDPVAVLSPGFWLSFAAVAIIGLSAAGRLKFDQSWQLWGRLQWRISLALIPLLIFLFQQASIISPLTNLVAIPVVSFIVVPLVLIATSVVSFLPGLAEAIFTIADSVLSLLWWFLSYLANVPLSHIFGIKPSLLSLCLACIGFVLLLTPRGWPLKYMGIFLLLPLIFPVTKPLKYGEVEFTLLDVGQGLAAVVQTQSHLLLFDAGPRFSPSFDTGAAVVIPFLRQKSIKKVDMFIVSHQDNDHRGGVNSVKDEIQVEKLISSFDMKNAEHCRAGQQWNWDGVDFEILNPDESVSYRKRNNASCVLRIKAGEDAVLLSADIEKKAEKQLFESYGNELQSTYLVSPHHGSKTSSSAQFLEAVKPGYILIPVGYRNRYRMPHKTVISRYKERNAVILKTYQSGAITLRFGQKSSNKVLQEFRKYQQKYWNSRH